MGLILLEIIKKRKKSSLFVEVAEFLDLESAHFSTNFSIRKKNII